jgi:hypothetical protein
MHINHTNKIKNVYRQNILQYIEIHSVQCKTSYGNIRWNTIWSIFGNNCCFSPVAFSIILAFYFHLSFTDGRETAFLYHLASLWQLLLSILSLFFWPFISKKIAAQKNHIADLNYHFTPSNRPSKCPHQGLTTKGEKNKPLIKLMPFRSHVFAELSCLDCWHAFMTNCSTISQLLWSIFMHAIYTGNRKARNSLIGSPRSNYVSSQH